MTGILVVTTESVPAPLGHYRQAVRAGGFIHVSGQLPITPGTTPGNQSAPFEAQARLVIQNFLAIVAAGGAKTQDVVKVTAYIVGSANWPAFNKAFTEAFGDHKPARTTVGVAQLPRGSKVEIDLVAL